MAVPSAIPVAAATAVAAPQLDLVALHVGQLLEAEIAALHADGSAILAVKDTLLRALLSSGVALQAGQKVQLQVLPPASGAGADAGLPHLRVVAPGTSQPSPAGSLPAASLPAVSLPAVSLPVEGGADALGAKATPAAALPVPATDAALQQAVLQKAAGSAAVLQNSLAPLYANIAALSRRPLPEPLRQALDRLGAARLPQAGPGLARALARAVADSGIFLEARQAAGASGRETGAGDLKQLLLALKAAIDELDPAPAGQRPGAPGGAAAQPRPPVAGEPPQGQPPAAARLDVNTPLPDILGVLRHETEAALARIQLSQFASLESRDPAQPMAVREPHWTFELPVAMAGQTGIAQFQMVHEREAGDANGEGQARAWKVRFAVETPQDGPVQALVSLRAGRVGVMLSAERAATLERLQADIPDLVSALEAVALVVEGVRCQVSQPRPHAAAAGHFLNRRT